MSSVETVTPRSKTALRFGVICGAALQAWQAEVIRQLLAVDGVQPVLVLIEAQRRAGFQRFLRRLRPRTLLFQLYAGRLSRPIASRAVPPASVLGAVPQVKSGSRTRRGAAGAPELDFILHFGACSPAPDMLGAARYGVWSFRHGEGARSQQVPPAFMEVFRGAPATKAVLQRVTDNSVSCVVLREGRLRTVRHSYGKNFDHVSFESAAWAADVCRDILRGKADYLEAPPRATAGTATAAPGNTEMVGFWLRLARTFVGRLLEQTVLWDSWNVAMVDQPAAAFLSAAPELPVRWLRPLSRRHFLADPFGVWRAGRLHLLAEEFDYGTGLGVISQSTLDGSTDAVLRPAIRPGVHASYPYPVEHGAELYCVPETYQAREAALYTAVAFPHIWQRERALLTGIAAVDSTVLSYDGRWWLFCTDQDRGPDHRLFIWHALDLLGPWQPHRGNPVKCDITSARPAGTPFVADGVLYRPAQDCSVTYGARVVIHRVVELTPDSFREEPVVWIEPDPNGPYPHGLHHLASAGDVTLIDGKRRRVIPTAAARLLVESVMRLTHRPDLPAAVTKRPPYDEESE